MFSTCELHRLPAERAAARSAATANQIHFRLSAADSGGHRGQRIETNSIRPFTCTYFMPRTGFVPTRIRTLAQRRTCIDAVRLEPIA